MEAVAPTPPQAAVAASFVATSNQEALEAQPLRRRPTPLDDILKDSATLQRAFSDSDGDGPERGFRRPTGKSCTIIQSSKAGDDVCFEARQGLVSAICDAYNSHHELVLRPDDVWQAILTQLSFYVQAHAEELRERFVDFEGKKELTISAGGTLFTADFGDMAARMVDEQIASNIKDASMAAWLLPAFSTTCSKDRVVASVSVMATLQAYFEYKFCLCCGLPRVTLLGSLEDWRALRAKIDRLPEFDLQDKRMSAWHALLTQVLDEFVVSAEGRPSLSFWDQVCSHIGGGSGPSYLSGWVTVFAVFTDKGVWQGDPRTVRTWGREQTSPWPTIETGDLPVAAVAVPVTVDDNGVEYKTQMLAGQVGYDAANGEGTALQPRSDWCIAMAAPEAA